MNSKLTGMTAVVALVLVLPACSGGDNGGDSEPDLGEPLEITVLAQGPHPDTGVPGPRAVQRFYNAEEFEAALALYDSATAVPDVDFNASRVVLLSHGWAATGGYQIAVDKAYQQDNVKVLLDVILTRPGENCVVTEVITSPYQFVAIPSTRELVVRERQVTEPCNGQPESVGQGSLLQHTVLAEGSRLDASSRPESKRLQALDNADDFADLWHAIDPGEPVPEVDFASDQVVLLAQGVKPDPSHSLELRRVLDKGHHLQLDIDLVRVSGPCSFPAVTVLPYQFVQIPDTRRVVFNERTREDDC